MRVNAAGIALVKHFESLRLKAYLCPAGVPTIGFGHTGDVKIGDQVTEHQAEAVLAYDLERFEEAVEHECPTGTNDNQFSALVAFAFNVGIKAFAGSTLLRKFKAGDVKGAAAEFEKWTHAGEKSLPGLVARRAAERTLFLARPV